MPQSEIDRKSTKAGTGHRALAGIGRAGAGAPKPCCSVPAFVGPGYGAIRIWRRADDPRNGSPASPIVTADLSYAAIGGTRAQQPDDLLVRLRKALRRERLLGRSGACGYSVERHSALRRAFDAAASRASGTQSTGRVLH